MESRTLGGSRRLAPAGVEGIVHYSSVRVLFVRKKILAGCLHSVPFTRSLWLKVMTSACRNHDKVYSSLYIDDESNQNHGPSWRVLFDQMVACIRHFAGKVNAINLKLSDKATIVCSNDKCATLLVKKFSQLGINFNATKEARDLGITYTASKSKQASQLHKRFKKAANRMKKIKSIAKINKKSKESF